MAYETENKTLGTLLRERRYLLNMDLAEVAEHIQVPAKHLKRIEKGQWVSLPSAVYTKGFIRRYARALGMDGDRLIKKYEVEAARARNEVGGEEGTAKASVRMGETRAMLAKITSRLTRRVFVVIVFLAVIGYVVYQLSIVFAEPALTVTEPAAEETIVDTSTVTLAGLTEPGGTVLLNGEQLEVSPDGTFRKDIELLPGINILEVAAVSRFDRRSTVERTIIYREPLRPLIPSTPTPNEGEDAGENTPETINATSSPGEGAETNTTPNN